jgi:hypothetical protein
MFRFALLMLLSAGLYAAQSAVDIETAAKIYQDAAIREQVRASLGTMPAHIRQLFSADTAAQLSDSQLNAVTAAAKRGFRIDVFEAPALSALAANLDAATVKKTDAFLESDLGRRMVAADMATATLDEPKIEKIMNGEITTPSTPERDALFDKLEQASRSTDPGGIGRPSQQARVSPAKPAVRNWNRACARRCAAISPTAIAI